MPSSSTEAGVGAPRRVVVPMMAVTGAIFFVYLLREDVQNFTELEWADLPWSLVLLYLLSMAFGGALAGWLLAGMFGRRGFMGWVLAGIGGVLATLLACLIGSFFGRLPDLVSGGFQMADLVSILAGLLLPLFAMAGQPFLAAGWVVLIVAIHILGVRARG